MKWHHEGGHGFRCRSPTELGCRGAKAMTENQTACLKTEVGGP